jgi:putative DNA primase/helicase
MPKNLSETSAIHAFSEAIADTGIAPPRDIIPDGRVHRFATDGNPRKGKTGWYALHLDGKPAGVFGDWRTGITQTWVDSSQPRMTQSEREAFAVKVRAARNAYEAEQEARYKATAMTAQARWDRALPAPDSHPYLARKGVHAHGLREEPPSILLVPVCNDLSNTSIQTLQTISPRGEKFFVSGGKAKGGFFAIGDCTAPAVIVVCEGFATGASIHEATGHAVIVAFNAGNLQAVCTTIRRLLPDALIVVAGDDDWANDKGNTGMDAAKQAALSVGGVVVAPRFDFAHRDPKQTDFNDMATALGLGAVAEIFTDLIDVKKGMDTSMNDSRNTMTKGTTFPPLDDFATATLATVATHEVEEWDEVEPFSQVDAPEEFPIGALPERIQAAVSEVCAFVQAPIELTAVSALTAVSVAVQGLANVERANGLSGPCSIYALAIAESGERKSSVDGYFKTGLTEYEDRQREILAPVMRDYLASLDAWRAQRDGILDAIRAASKKRENTGNLERDLQDHDKAKPEGPRIPRFCRSSDTPESLAFDLANEWPSAGVLSSEAGIVFGGHAMQADSVTRNLAQLNQLWDGATLHFSRRTSQAFTVQNTRVTMGLAIQEGPLREFFDKSKGLARSTGFLARFLVCWPESTIGTRKFKAAQSWENLARFNGRIGQLLEQIKIDKKGGVEPVMLCLTPEAQDVWIQYHDEVEAQLGPLGEFVNVKDVASKSADNAARLACILHVFEHGLSAISADSMGRACTLALWFLGEAKRFLNHIDMPPETLRAKRLNDWLLERAKAEGMAQLSRRDIQREGPIRDGEQLTAAIERLTQMNRIKQVSIGKKRLVELNPELIGV